MKRILVILCISISITSLNSLQAETLSLEQVIEKVLQHYPSIRTAALQVEYIRQENQQVKSQLSWQLNASGGYRHDFSIFGSPNDRFEMAAGLTRKLSSGEQMGVSAAYSRDKSTVPISPFYPNPAINSNVELNFRMPLQKGKGNIEYGNAITSADLNEQLTQWQLKSLLDQLAEQVIGLYYNLAVTKMRLDNNAESIARSETLKKYLQNRTYLGLSEDKDILQINAQIKSQEAQLLSTEIQLKQQIISLNRLMNRDWSESFKLKTSIKNQQIKYKFNEVYNQILNVNAAIKQSDKKIKIAESQILVQRDKRKDQFDLVLFIGDKKLNGDVQAGYINENEVVGGARLEFNRGLDLSGFDAKIYQAQLQREIALQNKKQIMEDLKYDLAGLLSNIETGRKALTAFNQSVVAQEKKLDEARLRYKEGRADTNQLIQFENELSSASLSADLQQLDLQKLQERVLLLQGELWKVIKVPVFQELIEAGE